MKRLRFTFLFAALLVFLLNKGCLSDPVASFTADRTTVDEGESVQFSDQSENDPDFWTWTFEGGSPSTSNLQDPVVTYSSEGNYPVTLEVRNRKSSDMVTMNNYITVLSTGTDLTFVNTTHTPIDIEVGTMSRSIPASDSVTFYDLDVNSVDIYAETYATTAQGEQVGRKLFWNFTVDLPGGAVRRELIIGSDFFFLYITNNGTRTIGPIEVYDGDTEPLVANVGLPNNGTKYRIGYYSAWDNTQVRAYYQDQPDTYTYWDHPAHFSFPDAINQSVTLNNSFKKGTETGSGSAVDRTVTILQNAVPAEGNTPEGILLDDAAGETTRETATGSKRP